MERQLRGRAPLSREAVLELLAERYHWTFEESKKLPKSELDALLRIIKVKDKINQVDKKRI